MQWRQPEGGLYVWARLPAGAKTGAQSKIFKETFARDVLYVPGELCYANDTSRRKPQNEMRLSFGSASEKNIRKGIARLGAILCENLT